MMELHTPNDEIIMVERMEIVAANGKIHTYEKGNIIETDNSFNIVTDDEIKVHFKRYITRMLFKKTILEKINKEQ